MPKYNKKYRYRRPFTGALCRIILVTGLVAMGVLAFAGTEVRLSLDIRKKKNSIVDTAVGVADGAWSTYRTVSAGF